MYLKVELLGHIIIVFNFLRNFHIVFYTSHISTSHREYTRVQFLYILANLLFLILAIPVGIELVPYDGFDFYFPND